MKKKRGKRRKGYIEEKRIEDRGYYDSPLDRGPKFEDDERDRKFKKSTKKKNDIKKVKRKKGAKGPLSLEITFSRLAFQLVSRLAFQLVSRLAFQLEPADQSGLADSFPAG